jgi:hypothetical protein
MSKRRMSKRQASEPEQVEAEAVPSADTAKKPRLDDSAQDGAPNVSRAQGQPINHFENHPHILSNHRLTVACMPAAATGSCPKPCCGHSKSNPATTAELLLSSASVWWRGRVLELTDESPLAAIAGSLGGVIGGDVTGTVCLIFSNDVVCPPSSAIVLVRGKVRWVAGKGAIALFVDTVTEQPEGPGPEKVPEQLVFCRSAPVMGVAVQIIGGDDPDSYRVLIKKNTVLLSTSSLITCLSSVQIALQRAHKLRHRRSLGSAHLPLCCPPPPWLPL